MSEQDAFKTLDLIFTKEPQPPNFYNLRLDETNSENEKVNFNDILMTVYLDGMSILFGSTNLQTITQDQYEVMNKYMQSLGYMAYFKYEFDENNFPINLKVWFERL